MRSTVRQWISGCRTASGHAKRQGGYTLIELAVVITIIGLLIATFSPIYQVDLKQTAVKNSQTNLALINSAIGDFRAAHGRYPCPASLTADRSDPKYGFEDCTANTVAAGSCTAGNGICIQTGMRQVTLPDGTVLNPTGPAAQLVRVQTGGIPFRQLNLVEDEVMDGWNDRYTYSVTENLTNQQTFGFNGGAIDVRNTMAAGVSVLNPSATADFIVTSQGEDRAGAYTRDGVQFAPCPAVTKAEGANCQRTGQAIYTTTAQNNRGGTSTNQFDDYVSYYSRGDVPAWQLAEDGTNSGNIQYVSKGAAMDPALRFMVSNSDAIAGYTGQNIQDTRVLPDPASVATSGQLRTGPICDENGANCTSADAIGSDLASGGNNMQCPNSFSSGAYMTGIENNHAICTDDVRVVCGKGQAMTGIGADGKPVCSSSPCASTNVTLCGSVQSLPQGSEGNQVTLSGGANYQQTFQCMVGGAGAGSWTSIGTTGSCTCTTTTATRSVGCGTGYTGKIKQTHTMQCPSGTWSSWVEASNTCVCVGATQTQNLCPTGGGYTGSHNQTRTFTCNAAKTSGAWSAWADSSPNTCACTAVTKQQTKGCPSGQAGSIIQTATYNCSASKWGSWKTTSNTCACDTSITDSQTLDCPTRIDSSGVAHEQIGEITQTRSMTCPSGNWGAWTTTSNTCQDKPPVTCYWVSKGSGNSGSTAFGAEVGSGCGTCGASASCHQTLGSSTFKNYNTCSCE